MSLRFQTTHRTVILGLRNTGTPLPWTADDSWRKKSIYQVYSNILLSIVLYQLVFGIYSAVIIVSFQERCRLGNITSIATNSALLTLYFILCQQRLVTYYESCNILNERIVSKDPEKTRYFREMYLGVADKNNSFTKKVLLFVCWTPVIYCIPVPVIDSIKGSYRATLPLPILSPYDDHRPGVYELTFCLHMLGLVIAVTRKFGNDCFFLALFKVQIVYLRHLTVTIKSLGLEFKRGNSHIIKKKLVAWIQMHQEIVRNFNELISLYTPVICIYYANLIVAVVFGIFVQIKHDKDGLVQRIGLGGFCLISLFQLYIQCSTNDEVSIEAEKLGFEIYNTPWYLLDKSCGDMIRLMLLKANQPVDITAFKAPALRLNREAFVGFMASTITTVMAFSKINDLRL